MPKGLKGFQKGLIPWNKGKINVYSQDTKKKMSFWLGKKMSLSTRKKMSRSRKGRKATAKTRERIKLAQQKWRNPNVKIICQICEKQFEVIFSRKDKAKYCSKKCQWVGYKNHIPRNKGVHKSKTYGGFHYKVRKLRGTPSYCEECGTTTAKKFEWANLTGNYSDINDYKRMCASCHDKFDGVIKNVKAIKS